MEYTKEQQNRLDEINKWDGKSEQGLLHVWIAGLDDNTPPELFYTLFNKWDGIHNLVAFTAVQNASCPPDAFDILQDKWDGLSSAAPYVAAVSRGDCPTSVLQKFMSKSKSTVFGYNDEVPYYASRNRNCPVGAALSFKLRQAAVDQDSLISPHALSQSSQTSVPLFKDWIGK